MQALPKSRLLRFFDHLLLEVLAFKQTEILE